MVELGLGFDANMKVMHRKIAHEEIIYMLTPRRANPRAVVCQILKWSMCNLQTAEAQGNELNIYSIFMYYNNSLMGIMNILY